MYFHLLSEGCFKFFIRSFLCTEVKLIRANNLCHTELFKEIEEKENYSNLDHVTILCKRPVFINMINLYSVKQGIPSDEELEKLSMQIGECWKPLGRRLDIEEGLLTGFYKDNDEFREKIYKMLLHWKQRDGQAATYQVLYAALCHELVSQRLLGEEICCE